MKTSSSFLLGDIDSLLRSCDELLSLANTRMLYFDELPEDIGLDELLKQQDEAVIMASVLMDIHGRLTNPELLEAVAGIKIIDSRKIAFCGGEREPQKKRKKLSKLQRSIVTEEETEAKKEAPRYVHTDKAEMRTVKKIEEEVDKLLATNKILSERLCAKLREIQDKINLRLEQNDKMVDAETKEKRIAAKEVLERLEAELLQAKKNAAW